MMETAVRLSGSIRHDLLPSDDQPFFDPHPSRWRLSIRPTAWRPPTDVFETEEAYFIRVEIAGMREEDFSVQLDGRILMVRGQRTEPPERRAYHQMEIRFGEFQIEIELPGPVLAGEIGAKYQEGFLVILLPKQRPQHIQIQE